MEQDEKKIREGEKKIRIWVFFFWQKVQPAYRSVGGVCSFVCKSVSYSHGRIYPRNFSTAGGRQASSTPTATPSKFDGRATSTSVSCVSLSTNRQRPVVDTHTTYTKTTRMAPRLPIRCWAQSQIPNRTVSALAAYTQPITATTTTTSSLIARPSLLLPTTQTRGKKYGWSTLEERHAFQLKYNNEEGLPERTTSAAAAQKRKERNTPLRTGVLATKMGMTGYYTRNGKRFPCTILQMDQCQVVAHKNFETHGYCAVQIGSGSRKPDNVTAPQLGYYEAKGIPPKEHLVEFQVRTETGLLPPIGAQLLPDWFHKGQWVDVRANTRGMGFEGGMKRHGFSGQEASHGNSLNHRTIGSAGPSQGSGSRVLPGKKMPGRMGNERHTVQNLAVLRVDNELGIIVVKGCVSGPKGALVMISDAVKKPPPPQQFIDKMNNALNERFPNAAEDLERARKRHLELKLLRSEDRIEEALKLGVKEGQPFLYQTAEKTETAQV